MKEILEEVFGQEGLISQKFKDYKVRESQVENIITHTGTIIS